MAAKESSKPTDLPPIPKPEPAAKSNAEDGPGPTIEKIRVIVDKLLAKFTNLDQPEELRKTRSMAIPMTDDKQAPLRPTKSVPKNFLKPEEYENSVQKLQRNLKMLEHDVEKVRELNEEVAGEVGRQMIPLDKLLTKVKETSTTQLTKGMKKDLEDINKKIFTLMCEVPLLTNKRRKPGGLDTEEGGDNNGMGIVCLHGIHANEKYLKERAVFKDVQKKFMELEPWEWKICLLSLAVFPENQEVNRTMLMYWWLGEDILPKDVEPEVSVKAILDDFTEKKLIEPVENKRKVEPNSYKMTPFVHSALVLISKDIGLFDMYHEKKQPTMNKSDLLKVCLVEGSSSQKEARASLLDAKEIETVFNVSERFPDFTFKWFSVEQSSRNKAFARMRKVTYSALKVFYLGRWERTAKRHIEVENPELMKNLKHLIKLRLLSFQGVSRIERLDDAVCKLHELIILDLRACYNLEKLPDKIDSLTKLIYLDITECYMIDRMPKRLSWLDNLEVLKGFVVSDATDEDAVCTLVELEKLTKLRKLSITINKGKLTVGDLFRAIEKFTKLEKLKVAWGWINEHDKHTAASGPVQKFLHRTVTMFRNNEDATEQEAEKPPPNLPTTLRKLDLQCFPGSGLPKWLTPERLVHLEKLYIKGGIDLTGFGMPLPDEPTKCTVKILRLKFLPRLKVEWKELSETYFPKLEFLEKYQCPQVSLCPCDGIGIWRNPKVYSTQK